MIKQSLAREIQMEVRQWDADMPGFGARLLHSIICDAPESVDVGCQILHSFHLFLFEGFAIIQNKFALLLVYGCT